MKYLCYINNECIEEIFLLPSLFSTFPSRSLFKGDLCRERFRGGFVFGFQSIRNLSSFNADAGSQNVKKGMVLCVKKQQRCTCITLFGTFFSLLFIATFYGGRERAATNFFLSRSLFLKIAAFFTRR